MASTRLVHETPEELVLHERPIVVWMIGVALGVVGLAFLVGGLASLVNGGGPWRALPRLAGAAVTLPVAWLVFRNAPATLVRVPSHGRLVLVRRTRLARSEEFLIERGDIRSFEVVEERDSDGDPWYWLEISLRAGRTFRVSVTGTAAAQRPQLEEVARRMRARWGIPEAA